MSNIILDYAVSFSQVKSLPEPSFGFLHKIGVAVPDETFSSVAGIEVKDGTKTVPAKIKLAGDFKQGLIVSVDLTLDSIPFLGIKIKVDRFADANYVANILAEEITKQTTVTIAPAVFGEIAILTGANFSALELTNLTIDLTDVINIVEVTDKAQLLAISTSYAYEIDGVFDGGLNRVSLILLSSITDLKTELIDQESSFYTIHSCSAYKANEFMGQVENWKAVKAFASNSNVNCSLYSKTENTCTFFNNEIVSSSYKSLYSFAKILSATFWRNQQYISAQSSKGAVLSKGFAESLFDDRVSFYLHDETSGTRLGFFVAGGLSITTPYIAKEIELKMQYEMTNFLTVNQPFNVELERAELERIASSLLEEYKESGYLDPNEINEIKVTKSAEVFVVNGNLTTSPSIALWRIKIDSFQTQG